MFYLKKIIEKIKLSKKNQKVQNRLINKFKKLKLSAFILIGNSFLFVISLTSCLFNINNIPLDKLDIMSIFAIWSILSFNRLFSFINSKNDCEKLEELSDNIDIVKFIDLENKFRSKSLLKSNLFTFLFTNVLASILSSFAGRPPDQFIVSDFLWLIGLSIHFIYYYKYKFNNKDKTKKEDHNEQKNYNSSELLKNEVSDIIIRLNDYMKNKEVLKDKIKSSMLLKSLSNFTNDINLFFNKKQTISKLINNQSIGDIENEIILINKKSLNTTNLELQKEYKRIWINYKNKNNHYRIFMIRMNLLILKLTVQLDF